MSSDQDLSPPRPSSPNLFISTTPEGSPGMEPSSSAPGSGVQTPVFSESTTPAGSPQGGYLTPGTDSAEVPPPKFLLGRKPVQDAITAAGPSTPRSDPNGDHQIEHMASSSTSGNSSYSNDRGALPSQARPTSLGSPQGRVQLPSRRGPGARIVQHQVGSLYGHRRSESITNMAQIMPGPYFTSAPAPADAQGEVTVPEQTGVDGEDDPFVGTPIAHLSKGYHPVRETPGLTKQGEDLSDYVLPEIRIQRASRTSSFDSSKTVEDQDLYANVDYNNSSSGGSPDRKRGPGLLSDRGGDYNLSAGKTFIGAPPNPEKLKQKEVRDEYPLWEVKDAEDENDVRVYDFAYCAKKAPVTDRQWENVRVWQPAHENAPWPYPMPASELVVDDNATVIIERDDLNMEEQTFQSKYGSFKSVTASTFYNPDTNGREQLFAEDDESIYPDTIGTNGDDEASHPTGSPAKSEVPAAETSTVAASPASSFRTAKSIVHDDETGEMDALLALPFPNVATTVAPRPIVGGAILDQSPRHKRTTWGRVRNFFCLHGSSDEGSPRKGFFRRQLDRFKRE